MRALLAATAILSVLAACSGGSDDAATEPRPAASPPAEPSGEVEPPLASGIDPPQSSDAGRETVAEEPSTPEPQLLRPTPELPEGPYYPRERQRPSDRDSDLLLLSGSPAIASGEPLELEGQLVDVEGEPIAGALVELWQTDAQGIYLHGDDPRAAARDPYFQSYGQSESDADGRWQFRTITPAPYEGRPRHLHLKVTRAGTDLLTTQLFFANDAALASDSISADLGEDLAAVTIAPEPATDEAGLAVQRATSTLVVELRP